MHTINPNRLMWSQVTFSQRIDSKVNTRLQKSVKSPSLVILIRSCTKEYFIFSHFMKKCKTEQGALSCVKKRERDRQVIPLIFLHNALFYHTMFLLRIHNITRSDACDVGGREDKDNEMDTSEVGDHVHEAVFPRRYKLDRHLHILLLKKCI